MVASVGRHGRASPGRSPTPSRSLDLPRERALAALVEEANRHGAEPVCKRATMGFPPACIPTCLYLLLTTDSFEEAVIEVVNLGGDADTAGAILGALAGAHYGVDAIPERLLDGLQNREAIEARGDRSWPARPRPMDIPDFVETERQLCRMEDACRGGLLSLRQGGDLDANRRM